MTPRTKTLQDQHNGVYQFDDLLRFAKAQTVLCEQLETELAACKEALIKIRARVCGEAPPNWNNDPRTMSSRDYIADVCEITLTLDSPEL